jgi:predicted transcriptional regulator
MMGELVPQRLLDLAGKQLRVVTEVALERVAVDHDSILVAIRRHPVAEVLAVGVALEPEIGDDDRHLLEDALELLGQGVDRVGDQDFEGIRLGLIHCPSTLSSNRPGAIEMTKKLHAISPLLAVIAIGAGGIVWSGCGSSDSDSSSVREQAAEQVEQGTKKAEEAVEEGTEKAEKGLEEAKQEVEKNLDGKTEKKVEEARKKAEKGIEEGQAQAEKGVEEAKEQAEKYLE